MDAILARLAARTLTAGEKLPSIRRFAAVMQVSPATVVEAYDRLAAQGVIASRPGSGFYVAGSAPPLSLAEVEPKRERAMDPLWVSRQTLDPHPDLARPGCGWLPPEWMPNLAIRRAIRSVARAPDAILADYGGTRGSLGLRRLLARVAAQDGLDLPVDQILLTSSGTQAIDLICRFLLHPGDTVLVDDPCYFNFQALLKAHRARIVTVPYTQTGPDPDAFNQVLAAHRPRLYLTNSALHNPTGATMTPQTAHRILTAAAAHDLTIVEDEIFAEFEPEPSVRLAALDGLARVVRIGSFSKTLSASVRCGYIAARADWIEGLIDLQVATQFGGASPVATEIVLKTLEDGGYRKHVAALREKLARRRKAVTARLAELAITPWVQPRGGFYLWCRLPDAMDGAQLARLALAENMVLAPGNVFSASQTAPDLMRFNVAQMEPASFDVLDRAMKAAK
ncbi:MAG: PLP-dependent aminotransferase family protein [Bosea sp. (in: a-proteobacteria)]